jgi:siroheme synthase-like protein
MDHDGDLDGVGLVIAATNDPSLNDEVAQAARRAGILVNVVDNPSSGTFNTVATVRQGDVLVTVSTAGESPTLAALLRRRIEALIGPEYAELLEILRAVRAGELRELPASVRRQVSQELTSDQVLEWLRSGDRSLVDAHVAATLDAARAAGRRLHRLKDEE